MLCLEKDAAEKREASIGCVLISSLLIAYQVLGSVVGTVFTFTHLLLTKTLGDRHQYCLHSMEQETAA